MTREEIDKLKRKLNKKKKRKNNSFWICYNVMTFK